MNKQGAAKSQREGNENKKWRVVQKKHKRTTVRSLSKSKQPFAGQQHKKYIILAFKWSRYTYIQTYKQIYIE